MKINQVTKKKRQVTRDKTNHTMDIVPLIDCNYVTALIAVTIIEGKGKLFLSRVLEICSDYFRYVLHVVILYRGSTTY